MVSVHKDTAQILNEYCLKSFLSTQAINAKYICKRKVEIKHLKMQNSTLEKNKGAFRCVPENSLIFFRIENLTSYLNIDFLTTHFNRAIK